MQIGQTFSLAELIEAKGLETVQKLLQVNFTCKNPDIERFLHKSAVRFDQARLARTFFILSDESEILAYFTLSFKSIAVNVNSNLLKKLTGGLTSSNQLNVFLLAQIGKNEQVKNNPVHLDHILNAIYLELDNARRSVGGRVAILECENNAKLISLYEQNGFKLIDTVDDKHQLKTLFIIPKMRK